MSTPPRVSKRPPPRVMIVARNTRLTPNMIRVRFTANWIAELPAGIEGAHCKLSLPRSDQTPEGFVRQLEDGPRPDVRTYTIRHLSPAEHWMEIDFVDHGDSGPASAYARRCAPGDVCGFSGPGPVKLKEFYADRYVVAADMSALPVAAATLEAMPRDAQGIAFLEITSEADRQRIDAPAGIDMRWLIHADTNIPPRQSVDLISDLPNFDGTVQTCIAGESSMIKLLRHEFLVDRASPKKDVYLSGYWKVGMVEDDHQKFKNSAAA